MKGLNVQVEDEVYLKAKTAAKNAGMLLRSWLSRAIVETERRERPPGGIGPPATVKELVYDRDEPTT